jgi:hypothetical protein
MRLLSTIILCILIVGGTWTYLEFDEGIKREAAKVLYAKATGTTTVEIERTFECFGDSLFGEPALKVTFGGKDVLVNSSKVIPTSEPIQFELNDVEESQNSLTVYANATSPDSFGEDAPRLRAMLVRIMYDNRLVASKVFHADSNAISLGGDVAFEIPATDKTEDHQH